MESFVKAKLLALAVCSCFALGCGKGNDAANHNKNLPPVTAKPGDLKMVGAGAPGAGNDKAIPGEGSSAPQPSAPP